MNPNFRRLRDQKYLDKQNFKNSSSSPSDNVSEKIKYNA
jgi:hypothetical protein